MAITGCSTSAKSDDNYFVGGKEEYGVWLGTIDDLWKFGKPTGTGGPWKETEVEAGELSDPYLMYGFDGKRVELSHDGDEVVVFEMLYDFVPAQGRGDRAPEQVRGDKVHVRGDKIAVLPGEVKVIEYEDGFSAFWVKVRVDKKCMATAQFTYF